MSAEPEERPVRRSRRAREPVARAVIQKVKLTETERERLRARATGLGVSVPRLLVESALEGRESSSERRALVAELFEVRRLVATVANNVNQLAKAANISGQVTERSRLERTLSDVDELLGQLRGVTSRL